MLEQGSDCVVSEIRLFAASRVFLSHALRVLVCRGRDWTTQGDYLPQSSPTQRDLTSWYIMKRLPWKRISDTLT